MNDYDIMCLRCNGKGKVYKGESTWKDICFSFFCLDLYLGEFFGKCFLFGFIGGIIELILFIIIKTKIYFFSLVILVYFTSSFLTCYALYFLSGFRRNNPNIILNIIYIIISIINSLVCSYFFIIKGKLISIIGGISSFFQGVGTGFSICYIIMDINFKIKDLLDLQICPLCKGKKFLSKLEFEKYERCSYCTKNCGYEDPQYSGETKVFCSVCGGKGYNLKENNIIEINIDN